MNCKGSDSIRTYIYYRSLNKQIIKIGDRVEILNMFGNLQLVKAFIERLEDLTIEIYYESIFKKKWKYDGEETVKLESFEGLKDEELFVDYDFR